MKTAFGICGTVVVLCMAACGGGKGGSACPAGQMQCGGVCTNPSIDPQNCGACGAACPAGEVCASGRCGCPQGLAACGGDAGATCVDTKSDSRNCGTCGAACPAGTVCSMGSCALTCASGLTQCGQACVSAQNDPANCGGCGKACGTGQVCDGGSCAYTCAAPGALECAGSCVDPQTDNENCGGCGRTCGAGTACVGGQCTPTCAPGYTQCGTTSAPICVNLAYDPGNCGTCGTKCPPGTMCQLGTCQATCASPYTTCVSAAGSYCASLLSDPANCGLCGKSCPAGWVCSSGACAASCQAPTGTLCGSVCVDVQTDNVNCGRCGTACSPGTVCSGGACADACSSPYTVCTSGSTVYCANLQSDPANCNACGSPCSAGQSCVSGKCALVCPSGLAACGNQCVDLASDARHCGACGTACPPNEGCVGGGCVGPVAYWPFEGNTVDMTGDGNNGVINGTVPYVAGYAGQAAQFGGSGDYISVASPVGLPLGGTPRTLEAWVNPTGYTGTTFNGLLWYGTSSPMPGNAQMLSMQNTGGASEANYALDLVEPGTGPVASLGTWNHVAFTFDGTVRRLFLNGVQVATDTPAAGSLNTIAGPIWIDGTPCCGYLSGLLDEVKVYDYARSPADLLDDATLAAHYTFDGGNALDSGPNHNHGTLSGGVGAVSGRLGQALFFDGSTGYVKVPNDTSLSPTNAISVEAWIDPTSPRTSTAPQTFVAKLYAYHLTLTTSDDILFEIYDPAIANWRNVATSAAVPLGSWSHVAGTYDGTTLTVYVNGVVAAQATSGPGTVEANTNEVDIPSQPAWGLQYGGAIDDVKIYRRARTAAEIAADANP